MNYWAYPGLNGLQEITNRVKRCITPQLIITTAADYLKVPVEKVYSRNREASVARVRRFSSYILRYFYGSSYSGIARLFGQDHTSIIYACRMAFNDISIYENERSMLKMILRDISPLYAKDEEHIFEQLRTAQKAASQITPQLQLPKAS